MGTPVRSIESYRVTSTHFWVVEIDLNKFDETFMQEFRESFFQFDTFEEHVEHITQLQARGIIDLIAEPNTFIEGYGPAQDMGISIKLIGDVDIDVEIDFCF